MTAISQHDTRYVQRNAEQFDEFTVFEDMGPAMRAEIEAAQGRVTHGSRCRIKSDAYDWRKLDAWMRASRLTNEDLVVLYELAYGRRMSSGTFANIRCGSYTNSQTVKNVMAIMENADVAHTVEQMTCNHQVAGSTPAIGSTVADVMRIVEGG